MILHGKPNISVDVWLPNREAANIEITVIDNRAEWVVFDDGEKYEGTVYNHKGTHLELLEKVLNGRNMS